MLVLARRAGEKLVIGKDITVTVLSIQGGVIRLGINAPRNVPVMRSELLAEGETQTVLMHSRPLLGAPADPPVAPVDPSSIDNDLYLDSIGG